MPPSAATTLLRASLPATRAAPGHIPSNFSLPCRKLVVEYCETWGSSSGMRSLIRGESSREEGATVESRLSQFARRNPGVEFVLKRRPYRHPVVRGLYRGCSVPANGKRVRGCHTDSVALLPAVNKRDKVICVRNLDPAAIAGKIQLLLDSSGEKLRLEKGHPVKSTTESVRGGWSDHSITLLLREMRRERPTETDETATAQCSDRHLFTLPHALQGGESWSAAVTAPLPPPSTLLSGLVPFYTIVHIPS